MRHEWNNVVVDGFAVDDFDFAGRLAASGQSKRDEVDTLILGPLVNAVNIGATLVITGYADRVDTGQDHRTSLQKETFNSWQRGWFAAEAILNMIGRDWLSPPPTTWDDLPYVGLKVSGAGATNLQDDAGTDVARLKNRRVELSLCRFWE